VREHAIRVELLQRQRACGTALRVVVLADASDSDHGVVERPEREQASPVGIVRPRPVSSTRAGLPEARYLAVRSLNQPDAVST
jgi:hypothetical protein